jgi:hypothetical protein
MMAKDAQTNACCFMPPENPHGFIAYHTQSGKPIPDSQLEELYDFVLGPIMKEVMRDDELRMSNEREESA